MQITYNDLLRYRKLKADLLSLEEEIAECNSLAYSVASMKLSLDGVRVKNKVDRIGNILARCDELKRHYLLKLQDCLNCMENVTNILENVSDPEYRRVLKLLYVDGLSAEVAAEKMNISYKTLYRYRKKALDELGVTAL